MLYLVPFAVSILDVIATAVEMLVADVVDVFTLKRVVNKKENT